MADLFDDDVPGSDLYTDIEEVGHGRFSEVYKAKEKSSGNLVALKHIRVADNGCLSTSAQQEISALRAIQHPNVIKLLGFHQKDFGVALVLEYCVANLRQLFQMLGSTILEHSIIKSIMQQLLQALAACHDAGFMHRDVSPSNVLVDMDTGLIKLADFGLAHRYSAELATWTADSSKLLSHQVGTRWYKAPELMFSSRHYTCAVDLWSAGCIFAEMLGGHALIPGDSDIDQICRMYRLLGSIREASWPGVVDLPDWGKLAFPECEGTGLSSVLPNLPPNALELLEGLLQYNPDCRMSASAALQAAYFQQDPTPASPQTIAHKTQELLGKKKKQHRSEQQSHNVEMPVDSLHNGPHFAATLLNGSVGPLQPVSAKDSYPNISS